MVVIALMALGMGLSTGRQAFAQAPDHGLFDRLLKKYVRNGVVEYQGFKQEEAVLDEYLKLLEAVPPDRLTTQEGFAFYINAYNAWTIKLILSGYPGVGSIKDLGGWFQSPWKKKFCRLKGAVVSLDEIEHGILRPRYQDPRVHFAINCASKGCPPLRSEAYSGARLEEQLDAAAAGFINDSRFNYFQDDTLYVSKIFDWFAEDFKGGIEGFFKRHADAGLKTKLELAGSGVRIKYLEYDWSLNGK